MRYSLIFYFRRRVVVASLLLAAAVCPAHADKCTDTKLKALTKHEAGILACSAKVASKGDPALFGPCAAKAQAKMTSAFEKAGSCIGVLQDCVSSTLDCNAGVLSVLSDTRQSKCEAARWKAAAARVRGAITCIAKGDVTRLEDCVAKNEEKFEAAYDKHTGCDGDGQSLSLATIIETSCVANVITHDDNLVVTALCPASTSTTTSSTTTTTTSSTTTTIPDCATNRSTVCQCQDGTFPYGAPSPAECFTSSYCGELVSQCFKDSYCRAMYYDYLTNCEHACTAHGGALGEVCRVVPACCAP